MKSIRVLAVAVLIGTMSSFSVVSAAEKNWFMQKWENLELSKKYETAQQWVSTNKDEAQKWIKEFNAKHPSAKYTAGGAAVIATVAVVGGFYLWLKANTSEKAEV